MSDLISREEAIDAVKFDITYAKAFNKDTGEVIELFKETNATLEKVAERIRALPASERWIPVSERLPDDLAEVNVTWVNHNPEPYYFFIKDKPCTGTAIFYKKQWFWSSPTCVDYLAEYGRNDMCKVDNDIEITAWQELPTPYRGGTK